MSLLTNAVIFCLGIAVGFLVKSLLTKYRTAAAEATADGERTDGARPDDGPPNDLPPNHLPPNDLPPNHPVPPNNDVRQAPPEPVKVEAPTYFEVGSTKQQVLDLLGVPDRVSEHGMAGSIWVYEQYHTILFNARGVVDSVSRPRAFGDKYRFRP